MTPAFAQLTSVIGLGLIVHGLMTGIWLPLVLWLVVLAFFSGLVQIAGR